MKILNGIKAPAKVIGLVIIKTPKTNIIIPLWLTYYMPQNPQHNIIQKELKHYNQFRIIRRGTLRCFKLKTSLDKSQI